MKRILIFLVFLIGTNRLQAQAYQPVYYWSFDNSDYLRANGVDKRIDVKNYNCPVVQVSSITGKAIDLQGKSCVMATTALRKLGAGNFSIEFLFRGSQFVFMSFPKQTLILRLNSNGLFFRTSHKGHNGQSFVHDLSVPFKGNGLHSPFYYTDDQWHHLVFTYDAAKQVKQIWVDGQSPDDFKAGLPTAGSLDVSGNDGFRDTDRIDELAFYNEAVPEALIRQHAAEVREGKAYTYSPKKEIKFLGQQPGRAAPDTKERSLDPNEFAPGYPQYSVQATDQLKAFPLPRIYPGTTLRRNMSWMDISYLHRELPGPGGRGFGNVSPQKAVELSEEMARNWNYYIDIPLLRTNAAAAAKTYSNHNTIYGALIDFANRQPGFPYSVIMMQVQSRPVHAGMKGNAPYVLSQQLPNNYYLRDEKGQPVIHASKKWLSPLMPLDVIANDGKVGHFYLRQLLDHLHRPPSLINENGEIFGHIRPAELLKKDPKVWADFQASGMTLAQYSGRFQARMDSVYRASVLDLEGLENTRFSFYNLSAINPGYWPDYSMRRTLNRWDASLVYSTPDFYPRTPDNWVSARGAFNGYGAIAEGRTREIRLGDRFFSPFVSAGWNREESNIRPAQYLSLLKAMVMLGADFFYAGYFNITGKNGKWPDGVGPNDPRGYIYQAAVPVYAQALRTWAPEFFEAGELLNPALPQDKIRQFRFRGKSDFELIQVRKLGNKYLIAGSVQPSSNISGNVPNAKLTSIQLAGKELTFEIRRQGSLYILDLEGDEPVFYQLDKWHQYEHPFYWTRNIFQEAELFSQKTGKITLRTTGRSGFDFSRYTTELVMQSGSRVAYNGTLRSTDIKRIRLVASNKSGEESILEVSLPESKRSYRLHIRAAGAKEYVIDGTQLGEKITGGIALENIKGTFSVDYFIIEAKTGN